MQATIYIRELVIVWWAVNPCVWEDKSCGETVPLFSAKSMHSLGQPLGFCFPRRSTELRQLRVSYSFSHERNVSVNVLRQMLRDSFCFSVLHMTIFSILLICVPSSGSPYSPAFLAARCPCNTDSWTEWHLRCFSDTALLAAIINSTWNWLMYADSVITTL